MGVKSGDENLLKNLMGLMMKAYDESLNDYKYRLIIFHYNFEYLYNFWNA